MNISIRRFCDQDAEDLSTIICRNLREVNAKDYSRDVVEGLTSSFTPEKIRGIARNREMFIADVNGRVVGTASLARDNRTQDEEYVCLTVFVIPEEHGRGIGSRLMQRVEETARSNGAKTLHVPASITAHAFYGGRGYVEDQSANPEDPWVWMTKKLD